MGGWGEGGTRFHRRNAGRRGRFHGRNNRSPTVTTAGRGELREQSDEAEPTRRRPTPFQGSG